MMNSDQPIAYDKIAQVYLGLWGDQDTQMSTRARINWLADQVDHSSALDIGCSEGILPILLGRKGIDAFGIDINPTAIVYANRLLASETPETASHVTFFCADAIAMDWGEICYDYVIIGEIIEHFTHPEELVAKAFDLLKDEGTLLVTTPLGYFPDPDHKYTFTLTTFLDLFRQKDLAPVSLAVEDGYLRFSARKTTASPNQWGEIDKSKLDIIEHSITSIQKKLHERIHRLKQQQEELMERNQSLVTLNQEYTERIHELLSNNQSLSARNQELIEKVQEYQGKVNDLALKNKLLGENLQQLTIELKQLERVKDQLNASINQIKLDNAKLVADQRALNVKYKGMTVRYETIVQSITYQASLEIRSAFKPVGKKTVLLPISLLKLFFRWLKKKSLFQRQLYKIYKLLGKKTESLPVAFDEKAQEKTFISSLDQFIRKANANTDKPVIIINSTTKRMNGLKRINRPMAFANELAKMDIPTIYIYYRWKASDDNDSDYAGSYLLQFPNTLFHKMAAEMAAGFKNRDKLFLISIPDVCAVSELTVFKFNGWKVGYEVRDDWSEFSKAGVGNWYNPAYEIFLCSNADFVTAVGKRLYSKMIDFGASDKHTRIIPNGINDDFLNNARSIFEQRKNGYKGKGIIGYFGHLTEKWFNWDLLIETAQKRPDLRFEIIGFDAPSINNLPSNIKLLGEKTHAEIIEIARNWSLAIIPFKNNDLSKAVDPIKLYEYQALGLPCVSCLIEQIKGYPFTFIYEKDIDFENSIEMGLKYSPAQSDWEHLQQFIGENIWKNRVLQTLHVADVNIT